MKSEVWKIVINSVSLWSESRDTKLHKNTPALLPHLPGGNTHTHTQRSALLATRLQWQRQVILRDLYSRINQGILANLQRIRLREGAARCWLRKKLPQTDRHQHHTCRHNPNPNKQSAPIYGKQKGFPLPDTTFPSWFSWDSSLCV